METILSIVPLGRSSTGSVSCSCMIATDPSPETTMPGTLVPSTVSGCGLVGSTAGDAAPVGGAIAAIGSGRCRTVSRA